MKAKRIIQIIGLSLVSLIGLAGLIVFLPSGEILGKDSVVSAKEQQDSAEEAEGMDVVVSSQAEIERPVMTEWPNEDVSFAAMDVMTPSDEADVQTSSGTDIQTPSETAVAIIPVVDDTQDISHSLQVRTYVVTEPNVRYVVAEIKASHPQQLRTAFAQGEYGKNFRAYPSKIASDNQAIIAVNGDYCGFRNEGIVIRNGELYRNQPSRKHLLMIDQNGDFHVLEEKTADGEDLVAQGAWQTFSFGPAVVMEGEAQEPPKKYFISSRAKEPRTAIGQVGPLEYVMVAVEGRSKESDGMSLRELGELMQALGCQTAYNLDGGGTSTMVFHDEVINRVSGKGERSSSDIIYFEKME